MTRVLIATGISFPQIGGPATYSKILGEELPKRGITTEILSFDEVRHFPKLVRHFLYFLKVFRKLWNFDLVYAQDPVSVGLPSLLAAKIVGKRLILKIVGDYAWEQGVLRFGVADSLDKFYGRRHSFPVGILLWVEHLVSRGAYRIIVPSHYLKGLVIKRWGVQSNKVRVIYNTFETPETKLTKSQARSQLGLENQKVILTAGRLVPWKRFELLIEWLAPILRKHTGMKLFIAGSGPLEDKLKKIIRFLGLEKEVTLLGSLKKDILWSYLRAADLFVLNSTYEGFSHQLLEALAAETPVVATNVGGNAELIEDGKSGILFESYDRKTFRESVERLVTDEALSQRLREWGLKRLESFNKDSMMAALITELH
ncbi:MAG: glycosyl transferase group 1 protein [Parcubacteria group bacterium Gr01-1014_107]|nr:MAG: glycosyl transferase group 1 protein [Parcubacteria group bacterium Gr01-1014_107]